VLWAALHFPRLRQQALARGHASAEAEREALEAVAVWLGRFTPRVSLEPPCAVAAEIGGSLRFLGGIESFRKALHSGLKVLGFEATLALAPTARAALWRAAGGGRALEELPVEVTGAEPEALELLRGLGVSTLADLMRLPRDGVALRFGQRLLGDLDRALGRLAEPRAFFAFPEEFLAGLELPTPAIEAGAVLFAARRLLVQLEGFLAARQAGVRGFRVGLSCRGISSTRIEVKLSSPGRDAAHFAALLRERLGRAALGSPVEAIRIEARDAEPFPGATAGLFRDACAAGEEWARLVERLVARLGEASVHGLAVHPDHRPERAWKKGDPGINPGSVPQDPFPGPRPLWLLETPRRLGERDFTLLAGPERIETGWWDGAEARRDYFIARTPDASLVWVYRVRSDGGWFLHGIFA
jgi:protein ImuB